MPARVWSGVALLRCPFCGHGTMQLARDLPPIRGYLLWLLALLGLPILGKETDA